MEIPPPSTRKIQRLRRKEKVKGESLENWKKLSKINFPLRFSYSNAAFSQESYIPVDMLPRGSKFCREVSEFILDLQKIFNTP